jgi:site-specific DNA-methyltransferase (cytosine-N4-specific)
MKDELSPYYETELGNAYHTDSLEFMRKTNSGSVDLILTSPPFALRRKKSYGNVAATDYWEWFKPFAYEFWRILKPKGSLVIDIGGAWNKGEPTRSLYHFELVVNLCNAAGPFKLAQEFFWYNPAKLPSPAQWVTVERIRVKDSVNPIWWLSKSSRPKASNRRVLKPYSESMEKLLKNGYNKGLRPSGHRVGTKWSKRNEGAIPSNLIIASNTRSSDPYLSACKTYGLKPNPARFVRAVPEFFVKMLTLTGDKVFDPFAGSNVVGEVCESLGRRWMSAELDEEFVVGSSFRFPGADSGRVQRYLSHKAPEKHSPR